VEEKTPVKRLFSRYQKINKRAKEERQKENRKGQNLIRGRFGAMGAHLNSLVV
jgi:hypothetical protein